MTPGELYWYREWLLLLLRERLFLLRMRELIALRADLDGAL